MFFWSNKRVSKDTFRNLWISRKFINHQVQGQNVLMASSLLVTESIQDTRQENYLRLALDSGNSANKIKVEVCPIVGVKH